MFALSSDGAFCNKLVITKVIVNYMKNKLYKIRAVIIVKYAAEVQTVFAES